MVDRNREAKGGKARGRPSSFDRDEMVERVMNLFWDRGYKGISFNEIAQLTGLTRASLYNAFESKEALLVEALEAYFSTSPDAALDRIAPGVLIGPVLYRVFDEACHLRASDPKRRGCLAVNCLTELSSEETDLGQTLRTLYDRRRTDFHQLIARAIAQGELPPETNAEVTGDMILSFMAGFNVFSKNGISEEALRAICWRFLRNTGFSEPVER